MTIVLSFSSANCFRRVCLPFFLGRNPSKQKRLILIPAIEADAVSALAPGIATTFILFL